MNTPGAPFRRDDMKAAAVVCRRGEGAGAGPLQQLSVKAIRPWLGGPERNAVRRSLPALPVSAVGVTTRQRRGAEGGHQAVHAVNLHQPEAGKYSAVQQLEAEREGRETASRREKAQTTEDNRGVSTGFTWSTEPPVSGERRLFRN